MIWLHSMTRPAGRGTLKAPRGGLSPFLCLAAFVSEPGKPQRRAGAWYRELAPT